MADRPSPQPMSASEYREACERLGKSPTYGVTVFGIPAKTAGRYNRGEAEVSPRDALLLRTLLRLQECEAKLERLKASRQAAE